MENQFFMNGGGVPHHHLPIHFENPHPFSSSSAMEIQPDQNHDCFYNNPPSSWEKSTPDHALHFDSALSSIVSSPAASNSNIANENFVIRELIGKLGTIGGGSGEISSHSQPLVAASCYNNMTNLGVKPMAAVNSAAVAEFAADPGFAERAAKFSCFGSRSFNGRTSQLAAASNAAAVAELSQRSNSVVENGKLLPRVSSSPSLKTLGSHHQIVENKNSSSPLVLQENRFEVANSQEESTISEQTPKPSPDMNSSRKRKASSKGKTKDTSSTPANPTKGVEGCEDSNAKRSKPNGGEANENCTLKAEEDTKSEEKQNKSNTSKPPEPPKDYIHVRARRGQATDSHSLAERVRREKISERMKLLQDLVPGCNKVTGKALMLDEIINYVQSLQRQVEFLSMKLASVNTRMDLSIESLIPKDIFQSNNSLAHQVFQLDSSATGFYGHQSQQNPVIHNNNIPNGNVTHNSVDPLLLDNNNALCHNILGMQLPPLNGFNESASQYPLTFSEDDLNTIVQMGFGQTSNRKTPVQSPSFNGSNQVAQMKVEL